MHVMHTLTTPEMTLRKTIQLTAACSMSEQVSNERAAGKQTE